MPSAISSDLVMNLLPSFFPIGPSILSKGNKPIVATSNPSPFAKLRANWTPTTNALHGDATKIAATETTKVTAPPYLAQKPGSNEF
jgi:hypothetical protein